MNIKSIKVTAKKLEASTLPKHDCEGRRLCCYLVSIQPTFSRNPIREVEKVGSLGRDSGIEYRRRCEKGKGESRIQLT